MKITEITSDHILFNNGEKITYTHYQDCCEYNYAEFKYLEDDSEIYEIEFPESLIYERINNMGFRFGFEGNMFFVPCYSEQNGWYSDEIEIFYANKKVFELNAFECEEEFEEEKKRRNSWEFDNESIKADKIVKCNYSKRKIL